jgi:hypothetical protein
VPDLARYDPVGAVPVREPDEDIGDRASLEAVDRQTKAEELRPCPAEPEPTRGRADIYPHGTG